MYIKTYKYNSAFIILFRGNFVGVFVIGRGENILLPLLLNITHIINFTKIMYNHTNSCTSYK
jgi:hypothetical protein